MYCTGKTFSDVNKCECIYVPINEKGVIEIFDFTRLLHFVKHCALAAYYDPCSEYSLEIRFVYENSNASYIKELQDEISDLTLRLESLEDAEKEIPF